MRPAEQAEVDTAVRLVEQAREALDRAWRVDDGPDLLFDAQAIKAADEDLKAALRRLQ